MKQNATKQKVSLWQLFVTFFKVGAFTFGGGYAMIAILEEELISKKKWITEQDMLDMLVIAESTPGVIAVNTATSVGYKVRGVVGALLATLGVVLPSFCIIFGLSFAINAFKNNEWYQAAFRGIQACVTVLIVNAFTKLAKQLKMDAFSVIMLVAAFCVVVFTDFNVIFVILIGGVAGVAYSLITEKLCKKPLALQDNERLSAAEQNAVETDETHADGTSNGDATANETHCATHHTASDGATNVNNQPKGEDK